VTISIQSYLGKRSEIQVSSQSIDFDRCGLNGIYVEIWIQRTAFLKALFSERMVNSDREWKYNRVTSEKIQPTKLGEGRSRLCN